MQEIFKDFDGFKFTSYVKELLFDGATDAAKDFVETTVSRGFLDERHYRVNFAGDLIKSVERHVDRIEKSVRDAPDKLERINAQIFQYKDRGAIPKTLDTTAKPGAYSWDTCSVFARPDGHLEQFLQDDFLGQFAKNGFSKTLNEWEKDRVTVARSCRFSALPGDASTTLIGNRYIIPELSARVAKSCCVGLYQKVTRQIPEAIVLPFPHSAANYYHAVSEMVYGLRVCSRLNFDIPIVHGEDRFNLLPTFCDLLEIDSNRLIYSNDLPSTEIMTAYLPSTPPFYWGSSFVQFFRKAALRKFGRSDGPRNIYISRSKSKRSPKGEEEFEKRLQAHGFDILHAQEMSIASQIQTFACADKIVAPHGAGLANLTFCRDDVKIFEIYSPNMLSPDFFHRSKYISPFYWGSVVEDYKNASSLIDKILE